MVMSHCDTQLSWLMSKCYVLQWLCRILTFIKDSITSNMPQGLCWIVMFPNGCVTFLHSSSLPYVELVHSLCLYDSLWSTMLGHKFPWLTIVDYVYHGWLWLIMVMSHYGIHISWLVLIYYIPQWLCCILASIKDFIIATFLEGYVALRCSPMIVKHCDIQLHYLCWITKFLNGYVSLWCSLGFFLHRNIP